MRTDPLGHGFGVRWFAWMAAALLLAACAAPSAPARGSAPQQAPPSAPRTLVMAVNIEVQTLAPKMTGPTNPERTTRIFSAGLSLVDSRGQVHPYVAEALPQLNTERWKVLPDGSMETTWTLRPGLSWHDGTPLAAEDFAFAYRVYRAPLGVFTAKPQDLMSSVTARDARTLVIEWNRSYPDAARLSSSEFAPLPRHLLEPAFAAYEQDPANRDALLALRYWTTDFVGNGPFRLTNWEVGSFMEGAAFEQHPLGKPKIDRVVIRFISDDNVAFTNVLSGTVHFAMRQMLSFEQGLFLEREWATSRRGVVIYQATSTQTAAVQMRPEHLGSRALADPRVRRALAHGIDREALNDALFSGKGPIVHTFMDPDDPLFPEVNRSISKYPYDPRRLDQIMAESGFVRDRDGFFADEANTRFQPALWGTASTQHERQVAIMTSSWRGAGIEVQPYVIPPAQARDNQVRSTFPGLLGYGVSPATPLETFTADQIGTAANRWGGQNRGGWFSPEYDGLLAGYNSTLDPGGRARYIVQMMRLVSEELPNYPIYRDLGAIVHLSSVKGPEGGVAEVLSHWNIHLWEMS